MFEDYQNETVVPTFISAEEALSKAILVKDEILNDLSDKINYAVERGRLSTLWCSAALCPNKIKEIIEYLEGKGYTVKKSSTSYHRISWG